MQATSAIGWCSVRNAVRSAVLAACLSPLLGGCTTPSLNPLATDATTVADQGMIGSWSEDHGNETYVVAPTGDPKVYHLLVVPHSGDGATVEAQFSVVELGKHRFADLSPTPHQRELVGKTQGSMYVPAHCIVRVNREGDTLTIWQLSADWMKDTLKDGAQVLTHARVEDSVVITAPTAELQSFVIRAVDIPKAWDKPIKLERLNLSDAASTPVKAK